MTRVRVESFTISLDGCGAGPNQSVDNPLGVGGEALHDWVVSTRAWGQMHGKEGGARGIDDDFAARGTKNLGAWILGRNMFGPIRGPWPDDSISSQAAFTRRLSKRLRQRTGWTCELVVGPIPYSSIFVRV
jgi:dihydrofolate reductase